MKFRNYLKVLKIFFVIEIIVVIVLLVCFCLGAMSVYNMFLSVSSVTVDFKHIRALEQFLGGIPFLLRWVLVSLSGFFVVKNFKTIYSKLREYF